MLKPAFLIFFLLGEVWGQGSTISPALQLTPQATDEPNALPISASTAPTEDCFKVEIGLIFDNYPDETSWEIVKGRRPSFQNNNAVMIKESPYYDPKPPGNYRGASEKHIVCLPEGRYTFTIIDSEKDGMCCSEGEGRYVVTYASTGDIIASGDQFGSSESTTFSIPYSPPSYKDEDGDGRDDVTKNVYPPLVYPCLNKLRISLRTDDYGVETTFELWTRSTTEDYRDGTLIASGGPYTSDHEYNLSYCVDPGDYTFVLLDWACDGLNGVTMNGSYTLEVNGAEVYEGPQEWAEEGQYYELVNLEFTNEFDNQIKLASSGARVTKEYGALGLTLISSLLILAVF